MDKFNDVISSCFGHMEVLPVLAWNIVQRIHTFRFIDAFSSLELGKRSGELSKRYVFIDPSKSLKNCFGRNIASPRCLVRCFLVM